jgi:predicted helicase
MYFPNKNDKTVIAFNNNILIKNIPPIAYKYILNGRSAIEHIMNEYQITADEKSGIVMDPNKWCDEVSDPKYILKLVLSVISLSVKTMEIVNTLPVIDFDSLDCDDQD